MELPRALRINWLLVDSGAVEYDLEVKNLISIICEIENTREWYCNKKVGGVNTVYVFIDVPLKDLNKNRYLIS